MKHTIQILPADKSGRFAVVGAVEIEDTNSPVREASKAILAAGASPSDILSVTGDVTFVPMPLWKLTGDYRPPRKSDMARQGRH